ncbi:MAG TPA: hypothetical protein VLJ37_06875 [bacterium]|nr:hypothetical protein [bacterium]
MKKSPLLAVTAAALLAVGIAGAVEKAKSADAQANAKTPPSAFQICKDQGKQGKELTDCIRAEHEKQREARKQEREAKTQQASASPEASGGTLPPK